MSILDRKACVTISASALRAGCYNRPANSATPHPAITFTGEVYYPESAICRQVGRRMCDGWAPLPECDGCQSEKDEAFIIQARLNIDADLQKTRGKT